MTSSSSHQRIAASPASPARRLGALLYDGLVLIALWMTTLLLSLGFSDPATGALNPWFVQLVVSLETVGYYLYCWRRSGQTLGMLAWRLRLVDADGGPPGLGSLGLRMLVAPLSLAAGTLGYWWFYLSARQQTWHDLASNTYVVLLPNPEKT